MRLSMACRLAMVGLVAAWILMGCSRPSSTSTSPADSALTVVAELSDARTIGIGLRPDGDVPAESEATVEVIDEAGKVVSTKTATLADFGFS